MKAWVHFISAAFAAVIFSCLGPVAYAESASKADEAPNNRDRGAFNPSEAPYSGWKQATTRHFRFIYEEAFRAEAESYAAVADGIWNAVSAAYDSPQELTDVIITGRTDTIGAFAQPLTRSMWFFTNSPPTPDFGYREDWPKLVFTHELVHIANFDFGRRVSSSPNPFGPAIDTLRLSAIPGWEMEGLTTVLETELTSGGRGRSPLFELQYKAPALDNSIVPYEEIGKDERPPERQIYVYGYLLMRSIADRFGLAALADIERNRVNGRSFDDAVRLVTGETPETLWQDVRRALAKRYAGERGIDEGRIVTPRETDTSWYRPAMVTDTAIIGLRKTAKESLAAVSLDPRDGAETFLFGGDFADERSLTASGTGLVVAAMETYRGESRPGYRISTDLWAWKQNAGLKKLTEGKSLFQPSLSRSGNRLVALEAVGLRYRIVEVDLETGSRKPLIESDTLSFAQPALSPDGTTLAFLVLDGKRAALATAPMPKYEFAYPIPSGTIAEIANAKGPIVDLSDPSWTADGTLLCASNARGRLEVWQWAGTAGKPVVADPAGAYWADLRPNGVIYASFSGSGFVLKMKPVESWGAVPDFMGPSAPGEAVTLAEYLSDYPAYIPWTGEKGMPEAKGSARPAAITVGDAGSTEPAILRREESPRQDEPIKELPAGTAFYNVPRLEAWIPYFGAIEMPDDSASFGAGACAVFGGYSLQKGAQANSVLIGGTFYPELLQADAIFLAQTPLLAGDFLALGARSYARDPVFSDGLFRETGTLLLSLSLPVRDERFGYNFLDGALILGFEGKTLRVSEETFSASEEGPALAAGYTFITGIDFGLRREDPEAAEGALAAEGNAELYTSLYPERGEMRISVAYGLRIARGTKNILGEFAFRGRWFDLPAGVPLPGTLATARGFSLDTEFPGRFILEPSLSYRGNDGGYARLFMEKLVSFGENTAGVNTRDTGLPGNLRVDPWYYAGLEAGMDLGRSRLAAGLVTRFTGAREWLPLENSRFYLEYKLDALRGIAP